MLLVWQGPKQDNFINITGSGIWEKLIVCLSFKSNIYSSQSKTVSTLCVKNWNVISLGQVNPFGQFCTLFKVIMLFEGKGPVSFTKIYLVAKPNKHCLLWKYLLKLSKSLLKTHFNKASMYNVFSLFGQNYFSC